MKQFAVAVLCLSLVSGNSLSALANGMTAHTVAAHQVREKLEESDETKQFASLLKHFAADYYNGVLWPDAIQDEMKSDNKDDIDKTSHGRTTKVTDPKGYAHHYLKAMLKECAGKNFASAQEAGCGQALAFFAGAMAHSVVDGPWHGQFIDWSSREQCDTSELKGGEHNNRRHAIADTNVDFCLERRLRPLGGDISQPVFGEAAYHRKKGCRNNAGEADSFDGLDGICYKCPPEHGHQGGFGVKNEHVCKKRTYPKKKPHDCLKTGGFGPYKGKCYKCKDSKHDMSMSITDSRVCYKDHYSLPDKKRSFYCEHDVDHKRLFSDPRKGGECWSCPGGYERTGEPITTNGTKSKHGKDAAANPKSCKKIIKLPCDKLQVPSWAKRPAIMSDPSTAALGFVKTAYAGDGKSFINVDYAKKALKNFRGSYNTEGLGAAHEGVKDYGDKCDWIYEKTFSGQGGINDGIHDTVQLLAAVWSKIQKGEKFTVVRTGTYTYAVVAESGTAIVETRGKF